MMVVARIGPIASPTFLSIVFNPKPVARFSGGTDIDIMFTMGIIHEGNNGR